MGALLIEQNEKWAAGPRYLNMTVYHGIEKDDNSEEAGMLKLVKLNSRNLIYTNILDLTPHSHRIICYITFKNPLIV